jgi:hypothetical protein
MCGATWRDMSGKLARWRRCSAGCAPRLPSDPSSARSSRKRPPTRQVHGPEEKNAVQGPERADLGHQHPRWPRPGQGCAGAAPDRPVAPPAWSVGLKLIFVVVSRAVSLLRGCRAESRGGRMRSPSRARPARQRSAAGSSDPRAGRPSATRPEPPGSSRPSRCALSYRTAASAAGHSPPATALAQPHPPPESHPR